MGLYNKFMASIGVTIVAMAEPGEFVYEGQINHRGERDGKGVARFPDGSHYRGTWVADKPHGFGSLYGASGMRYKGMWRSGKLLDDHDSTSDYDPYQTAQLHATGEDSPGSPSLNLAC